MRRLAGWLSGWYETLWMWLWDREMYRLLRDGENSFVPVTEPWPGSYENEVR